MLSMRKGKYAFRLQCDSTRKAPTTWINIYKARDGRSHRTIFAKDDRKMAATNCPTRSPWFVKFKRRVKLKMGIIRKQNFRIPALTMAALQKTWNI